MTIPLPRWRVPAAPAPLDDPAAVGPWRWAEVPRLPPLVRSDGGDGSRPARWPTAVRICSDAHGLAVRFDCTDRRAWGTHDARDAPLWEEEAVELFLALDPGSPERYFEFEISPRGALFDARVENPTGRRAEMRVDAGWDAAGARWGAGPQPGRPEGTEDWWAVLVLPWADLGLPEGLEGPPAALRANFYRIERPAGRPGPDDELSAWSPTLADPPDFHQPARFGWLALGSGRIA